MPPARRTTQAKKDPEPTPEAVEAPEEAPEAEQGPKGAARPRLLYEALAEFDPHFDPANPRLSKYQWKRLNDGSVTDVRWASE